MSEDLRNAIGWAVWAALAIAAVVWCAAVEFFTDDEGTDG